MDAEKKMTKKELEELWAKLGDVPVDNDDKTESGFHIWPAGTDKYEIWRWFDEMYSKWGGVNALVYGDSALPKIYSVVLRLSFATDGDFRINLDGLKSFIDSRLGCKAPFYEFSCRELLTEETAGHERQVIQLKVWLPYEGTKIEDTGKVSGSWIPLCRARWMHDAIDEVMKSAYLWLFAEMSIANRHGMSSYLMFEPFQPFEFNGECATPRVGQFKNGIVWTPKDPFMSGNYGDSWSQWELRMGDANCDREEWVRRGVAAKKAQKTWEEKYIKEELENDD